MAEENPVSVSSLRKRKSRSLLSTHVVKDMIDSWEVRKDNESIAIFCESITLQGRKEVPVQIAIVDSNFKCRLNRFIKVHPRVGIENYKIFHHGLPLNMLQVKGCMFETVREELVNLIAGKVVVGYNLPFALSLFNVDHLVPQEMRRDIRLASFFDGTAMSSFESIVQKFLGIEYPRGVGLHCIMRNVEMAMRLYIKYQHLLPSDWIDS